MNDYLKNNEGGDVVQTYMLRVVTWLDVVLAALLLVLVSFTFFQFGVARGTDSACNATQDAREVRVTIHQAPELKDAAILDVNEDGRLVVKKIVAGPGDPIRYKGQIMTLRDNEYLIMDTSTTAVEPENSALAKAPASEVSKLKAAVEKGGTWKKQD